jgi:hypothetical protein
VRSLLPFMLFLASTIAYADPSAEVLAAVRDLMAGRSFHAENGMRQSYGELVRDGASHLLAGYAIRPDGTLIRVVDRLVPTSEGMLLTESVVGVEGAWRYLLTPRKGGGFVVRPSMAGGRFVSRECHADGGRSLCIKTVRGSDGRLAKLRYISAP